MRFNIIDIESMDYDRLSAMFQLYKFEVDGKKKLFSSRILDEGAFGKDIEAISFKRSGEGFKAGQECWLLLKASAHGFSMCKEIRDSLEKDEGQSVKFHHMRFEDQENVPRHIILQLLFNTLAVWRHDRMLLGEEGLTENNVMGKLLILRRDHIEEGKKGEPLPRALHPLELDLQPCCDGGISLSLKVRTFTRLDLVRMFKGGRNLRKALDLPCYTFDDTTMRMARDFGKCDDAKVYVQAQWPNQRYSRWSYMSVDSQKFWNAKLGVLHTVVRIFNERYPGLCSFKFREVPDTFRPVLVKNPGGDFFANKLRERLAGEVINVVDLDGDVEAGLAAGLKKVLESDLCLMLKAKKAKEGRKRLSVKVSDGVESDGLNICLVRDKASYRKGEDPYIREQGEVAVQHITKDNVVKMLPALGELGDDGTENSKVEKAGKYIRNVLDTCLADLCVKKDIIDGRLSLYDWEGLGMEGDLTFARLIENGGRKGKERWAHAFLTISSDGEMSFERKESLNLWDAMGLGGGWSHLYTIMAELADSKGPKEAKMDKAFILSPDGKVNVIREAGFSTLPSFELIDEQLADGRKNAPRGKAAMEIGKVDHEAGGGALRDATGMSFAIMNGHGFYFVGEPDKGPKPDFAKGCPVREVVPCGEDDGLFFDERLLLLNEFYFSNKRRLTVLPFPFAYLRNWCEMNNLIIPAIRDVAFYSIKTTGLDRAADEILQIGIIDGDGDVLLDTYVRPTRHDSWPRAQGVNGISPEMVADAPTIEELVPKVKKIFDKRDLLVGYDNFGFADPFLKAAGLMQDSDDGSYEIEDVMVGYAAGGRRKKLEAAAKEIGYEWGPDGAHTAVEDCRATLALYEHLNGWLC